MSAKAERTLAISLVDIVDAGANLPAAAELSAALQNTKAVFGSGSGAGQVNLVAFRKTTIANGAPSAPVTHDLKAIPGLTGANVAFTSLVGLYHYLEPAAAGGPDKVVLGASGASAFDPEIFNGTTPSVDLPKAGIFALDMPAGVAGWSVAAGTKDFKIDAGTFAGDAGVVQSFYCGRA